MNPPAIKPTNKNKHSGVIIADRPPELTQATPDGRIRFDFNDGLTVENVSASPLRLTVFDPDGGNTLFDGVIRPGGCRQEFRRYFLRLGFEIRETGASRPSAVYHFRAAGKNVLFDFSRARLGECIAWMNAVERFTHRHRCRPLLAMPPEAAKLFAPAHRNWRFVQPGDTNAECFATYRMALHPPENRRDAPVDHRHIALHRFGALLLGVEPTDTRPRLRNIQTPPPAAPYVCFRTSSSRLAWEWRRPWGWETVADWLARRHIAARVLDDAESEQPGRSAEISAAKCLIGPPDAAAWLAWAYGTKVLLLSGYSLPDTEIPGAEHIIEHSGCNGCRHLEWDAHDPDYRQCPRRRNCQCMQNISAERVISGLKRLL